MEFVVTQVTLPAFCSVIPMAAQKEIQAQKAGLGDLDPYKNDQVLKQRQGAKRT